jgi:hypothetical protein
MAAASTVYVAVIVMFIQTSHELMMVVNIVNASLNLGIEACVQDANVLELKLKS